MNKGAQIQFIESKQTKGGENMKRADSTCNLHEGVDAEMMSDGTLKRLLEYLKSIGWSDKQIVELLDYVAGK